MSLYGGIEAGGTKFVCVIAEGPQKIRAETRFPTTTPDETLGRAVQFFREHTAQAPIKALGVACFGPVDLNPASPTFGYITSTPKPGWRNTDVAGALRRALGLPVGFDTDVNAAALAEVTWGAAQGLDHMLYLTIGTGIGGGGLSNAKLLHGLVHPEVGHMRIPHDHQADPYAGCCPFHGDCFEGLASGPALRGRWGQAGETLPPDHPAWELEVGYIALALNNLICDFSPQRIILGGGVMQNPDLYPRIRTRVLELLNGYVQSDEILKSIDEYIVPPGLGNRAGVLGAIALAQGAVR